MYLHRCGPIELDVGNRYASHVAYTPSSYLALVLVTACLACQDLLTVNAGVMSFRSILCLQHIR